MKLNCYLFLALLGLFLFPVAARAQILFDNGPVFNSPGTGFGGADESVLYTTTFAMGTIGFGQQLSAFNRVADDFTLNTTSQIDSIVLFAYQTNSTTTSTITHVNFRIWNGPPDSVGSTIVFGDTTTNRLTSTGFSNVYRITETTVGNTSRPIMRNVCATPGLTLTPGIYWIDWQTGGSLASGPWQPARVPAGQSITGNAKQRLIGATGGVWAFAVDGGTGTPAQGFPFEIYGPQPGSLNATALSFPATCENSTNVQTTSISGSGLNGSNVVFGPISGFGFSTNPVGPFNPSVTLTYAGNTLPATTVYVQYAPTTAGSNNVNIPLTGGGVTSSVAVTASANSSPVVVISNSINAACFGGSSGQATVSVTGGTPTFNYDWTPGNPPGDGTNSVTGLSAAQYTCVVSDANGCTGATTVFIVQPSPINFSPNSQTNVTCFGGSNGAASVVPASGGSGGFMYNWTPGNPIGDGTTSVSGLTAMVYTCTVTDVNGCTQTITFNITAPAPLTVTASSLPSPAIVCAGSSVTLTGGGATTYSWTNGINAPTNGVPFVPSASSTYTVTGTSAGCSSTATIAVIVNTVPNVTASSTPSPASVCQGGSVTLTGNGAATYSWTDGTNSQTDGVSFVPSTSSTYTVTGTSAGCSSTATVIVTVNPAAATPTGTATPATICSGENSDLNAVSLGNSIHWYDAPIGGTFLGSVASATNYNVTPGSTTIYYAEAVTPAGGTQTFNYTGNMQSFVVPAGVTAIEMECWGAQGGANWVNNTNFGGYSKGIIAVTPGETLTIFVGNQPTTLAGGFNGGGAGDGAGRGGGGASDVRQGGTGLNNRVIVAGGGGGAGYWSSLHVVGGVGGGANQSGGDGYRDPSFAANPGGLGATVLAAGANGTCATFNNTNMAGAFGQGGTPASFNCGCEGYGGGGGWYGGAGSGNCRGAGGGSGYLIPSAINVAATNGVRVGDGQVTFTWSGTGCPSISRTPVTVTVNPLPTVTATATPSTTCDNSAVTPVGGGANSYVWSGGLTDNTPYIATTGSTTYTVTGTDAAGCSATSSVTVTVNPSSGMLATATSNQTQNHGDDFNINYYDASCNLIASVDDGSGGNILGLTISTVNVDANAGVHNGQPFVRRWYQITPANNVGVSAMVTLYIDQADFTDYNSAVTLPYLPMPTSGNNADPNIANIRITKNADAGLGNSPEVITPAVNWNGMYWELTFPVTGFSQFRVHSANPFNAALPVTITKFNGRKLNSSNLLEWTTANEQNNAYFNLQHGTNGIDFKTIAQVNTKAPNGNSQTELNYSFEHKKPSIGHNYYRLQQVDIDNQHSINAKVVDLIWGADGSSVTLYPNPTQDVLNIDLYTTKAQNTIVKVMDMSGRLVKEIQAHSEAGMNTYSLSLAELASGLYTVQVYDNEQLSHVSKVKKN